jgi:putative transposase
MSVAAGVAVMQAMFDTEWGSWPGARSARRRTHRSTVRPGARPDGAGRPLGGDHPGAGARNPRRGGPAGTAIWRSPSSTTCRPWLRKKTLAGVATRRHARALEPAGTEVVDAAESTARSATSHRFVAVTKTALALLPAADLPGLDVKVLMIDGVHSATTAWCGRAQRSAPPW